MTDQPVASALPAEFTLLDERNQRLLDAFRRAYSTKKHVRTFLLSTRIREDEVDFDGQVRDVWIDVLRTATRAALVEDLLHAALADMFSAAYHPQFRSALAVAAPGGAAPPGTLSARVSQLLGSAGPSRAPVVIALELADDALTDAELTRATCHLIVTLSRAQLASIEAVAGTALDGGSSLAEIVAAGTRVWARLTEAEPRLQALPRRIAPAGLGQPVAWCGRPEVLERLKVALQIAHTGADGPRGFLTLASGHYLSPITRARAGRAARTMRPREWDRRPTIAEVDLGGPDGGQDRLAQLDRAEVAVVVHPPGRPVLAELERLMHGPAGPPTRAVLAFGGARDVSEIDTLLRAVPFVCSAEPDLATPELRAAVRVAVREHAGTSALPCIVAAVQAAWVGDALGRADAEACRLGLAVSSWSWIGLPLFSRSFGEVEPAEHPHLMSLRSIATRGWYFDRQERIDPAYQAHSLAEAAPENRFHLYLSGAGGTGKSCFLRNVHDRIDDAADRVAVWYRVDSPSSSWENVESRIREETLAAIAEKMDVATVEAIRAFPGDLGDFLKGAVGKLRERSELDEVDRFDEIAVFVDQLERTFESGDEPNPFRLETISKAVVDLLRKVGTSNGVRVFVASRKQYLPDFLGSFRSAQACGLEFNVLQTISDERERVRFVQKVMGWCVAQKLVGPDFVLHDAAAKTLAARVDGHPLNTVLALVQLLSGSVTGPITEEQVERAEPWNKIFLLDLQDAGRDQIDWYFLLAMAHARSEIVRFEEVWWRLRMVSAELRGRVDALRNTGVQERLWLLGFLGRTIHARPDGDDPMGFVEFFHANLRDYLVREVMGQGRAGAGAAGGGTPATWRALDRLSGFAHDWAQTPQVLLADEIRVLMEHRYQVVEARPAPDLDPVPFRLLFLRDRPDARRRLARAAQECFALSALVHDEAGAWAMEQLFPDVHDRAHRCAEWLGRCPEHRPAVLRYLVALEAPVARAVLVTALLGLNPQSRAELDHPWASEGRSGMPTDVLLGLDRLNRDEMHQAVASVLAEPLFAARWRNEILLAVLAEALRQAGGRTGQLPAAVAAFLVASCGRDRATLTGVIGYCVDRMRTSDDANDRALGEDLAGFGGPDRWLDDSSATPLRGGTAVADRDLSGSAPLALLVGASLRPAVTGERLASWSAGLRAALGVPLPDLTLLDGETAPDQIELLSFGQRLARTVFCPDRVRVSKRRWEASGGASADALVDLDRGEEVLWLPPEVVAARDERIPAEDLEQAVTGWLEGHVRRSFDLIFDVQLEIGFMREVATTADGRRRLVQIGRPLLRAVLVGLVQDGVRIGRRRDAILQELADLALRTREPGPVLQRIRVFVKDEICAAIAGVSGEVTTILLAERLEEELANIVDDAVGRFERVPPEAMRLEAALRRILLRIEQDGPGPPAVLVTVPPLRAALADLLRGLDHRLPVLGFTELPQDLTTVPGGLVDVVADPGAP